MGRADLAVRVLVRPCWLAERLERLRVELDRQRRLGHRDVTATELLQVDVRVVEAVDVAHRHDALEERTAGIGAEAEMELALARVVQVVAGHEAAAVGHLAVAEAERVQHCRAVEPVLDRLAGAVHQRGGHAHERALEPGRHGPGDGHRVDVDLLVEAAESGAAGGLARDRRHAILLNSPIWTV